VSIYYGSSDKYHLPNFEKSDVTDDVTMAYSYLGTSHAKFRDDSITAKERYRINSIVSRGL